MRGGVPSFRPAWVPRTSPPRGLNRRRPLTAQKERFEALDALRGLACVLVATVHIHNLQVPFGAHILIEMFMVLSGFVLAHSYLYRGERPGTKDFIWRRVARMWPMHVFSLFFMYGVIIYGTKGEFFLGPFNNWNTLVQNLLLSHNIGLPPTGEYVWSWNYPSWSVSVELWVSIAFIFLVYKATKSWALLGFAALGLAILGVNFRARALGNLYTYNEPIFGWLNSGLLRGLSTFPLGIVAYRLFQRLRARPNPWPVWGATAVEAVLLVGLIAFLFVAQWGVPWLQAFSPWWFLFVIAIYALEWGYLSRGSRWLAYLGVISFSIYLNHAGIHILFNDLEFRQWFVDRGCLRADLQPNDIRPWTLIVTLFFSHVTYQLVERRAQRWMLKRNPFAKRASRPSEPSPDRPAQTHA